MLSPEELRDMQLKAAQKARRRGLEPALCQDWDLRDGESRMAFLRALPFLGDFCPPSWAPIEGKEFFVDASGFGAEDEPAMTIEQMAARLEQDLGYAITSTGEFQVYIQAYRKRVVVYL